MTQSIQLTVPVTCVIYDLCYTLHFIQQNDSHRTGNNMVTIGAVPYFAQRRATCRQGSVSF